MPKIKSHSGLNKKLKIRKSGTISIKHPGFGHNLGKKSTKINRKKRSSNALSQADLKRFKNVLKKI